MSCKQLPTTTEQHFQNIKILKYRQELKSILLTHAIHMKEEQMRIQMDCFDNSFQKNQSLLIYTQRLIDEVAIIVPEKDLVI